MDTFLVQVLSSAAVGMLSWTGGYILTRLRARSQSAPAGQPFVQSGQAPNFDAMAVRPPAPSVNFGAVLIHIGILQFVVNVVGFVIGFTVGAALSGTGASAETVYNIVLLLVLIFGTLVAIIAFLIIGLRVDTATRWQHLVFVALGTVILTLLVNSLLGAQALTPAAIVFAFVQTFVAMGIGGGLAMVFRPNRPPQQQYIPPGGVPQYPYGAWPNAPQYPPAGAPPNVPQYPPQGASWQPGYGQQPLQYPPQAPAGWGQQPGAQPPMYPVPQHPPNQQQGNQGNQ
jgi:hypothetical protein